ncbi:Mitochondrial amidoxime-reducing component 1 [Orchesella cincta]|uniref:Mitochondrial amidoxime-reducing component 1 n=1 Tax=Orchesella cincta TaxID=48709 RepID=A0A1D2MTV4_ORCCI|nr:Mitochondrial amidoxime-reducing component 1 [Orchesella cincta]
MHSSEATVSPAAISAVCISSLVVVLASTWYWKKSHPKECTKQSLKPEKWVKVGSVKKLVVYPIKSCQGVVVDKAVVTTLGLKCHNANIRDRDFMIANEIGRHVTMDKYPKMALIKVEVNEGDSITVSAPDMPSLTFTPPKLDGTNERLCRVKHDGHMKGLDCGDDVSQWFQEYLGDSTFRLCYHHINQTQRTFEPYMFKCPQFELSDMGAFHNETSYLLCSEESIGELNKRLDKESSWKNWRPTILIDQVNEPFAEVNWSFVKIGNENGILKAAVPCYRCPLTTVDPDIGVLPKDGEPLKTLRNMNLSDEFADKQLAELLKNKGIMGLRLGLYLPAGEGAVLNAGDPVYAALL